MNQKDEKLEESRIINKMIKERNESASDTLILLGIKLFVVAIVVYPIVQYSLVKVRQAVSKLDENITNISTVYPPEESLDGEGTLTQIILDNLENKTQPKPPGCPKSYMLVILDEICSELILKKEQCSPEDFKNLEKHKIPTRIMAKNSTTEHRGNIVSFLAGGLLLTSLGAALVELYKAKSQPGGGNKKSKTPLSRKCSLADLTVLKHHRKELVRRESILEVPEGGAFRPLGTKVSRPPLRLD